jgi:hypothetical protein
MAKRFGVGDTVALQGVVRLVDVAGDNTVTIEFPSTGTRLTVASDSSYLQLVATDTTEAFRKAPKGRQKRLIPDRDE